MEKSRYTKAQNKATQKYIHKNYDQITLRIRKDGEITRETIVQAADQVGESVNAYILNAVLDRMNKEKK